MNAGRVPDLETLERQATALTAQADALTNAYRRHTWVRFVAVFFPVPFVVVLLRLELEAWHYVVAGGAYLAVSAALYVVDSKASARCDEAAQRAAQARIALEVAIAPCATPDTPARGAR